MFAKETTENFISSIDPFRSLPPADLKNLVARSRELSFRKGEWIFDEGGVADSVWVVLSGRVRVFKTGPGGKSLAVESLGRGELFGVLCRLGGQGRSYPCAAAAAGPVTVLRIPDATFLDQYAVHPGLVRGVCSLCSRRLKDVQELRCLGHERLNLRIASILLRLRMVHGDLIPFTKKEISELVGSSLEATFREISKFQRGGVLHSARGSIRIVQPQALRELETEIAAL